MTRFSSGCSRSSGCLLLCDIFSGCFSSLLAFANIFACQTELWRKIRSPRQTDAGCFVKLTHTMRTRAFPVTFRSQLIALITRPADPSSHWTRGRCSSARPFMNHYVSLTAGSCSDRPIAIRMVALLHNAFSIGKDVSALVELQRVLRGVSQCVEPRCSHVLRREVLLVAHHIRHGQMTERRGILMKTGGNHSAKLPRSRPQLHQ